MASLNESRRYRKGGQMRQATRPLLCFFGLALCFGAIEIASSHASNGATYRYAYYLFLSGTPNGCEDCYVPLLVTKEPLEQVARLSTKTDGVLIITYERDSIWHNDGVVAVAPAEIESAPRIIHLRGRKYRYQEISPAEALKLFESPLGTIPISRPMLPDVGSAGPTLQELISSFRNLN